MAHHNLADLGPLEFLAGAWEGDKGDDVAPSGDRGTERNLFRERMTFVPIGAVDNHEQKMFGLRYSTVAYRIGVADPFHEETGYWIWYPADQQVMRCFLIPRGISVIAGGRVPVGSKSMTLTAEVGSHTHGICSNEFLDREFKTLKYRFDLTTQGSSAFSYESITTLQIKGQPKPFLHIDKNVMKKVENPPGY